MLAWAEFSVVTELTAEALPRLTNRTLTAAALRGELDEVREKGLARERDEAVLGESSVAAPIFDHGGHAVGAIGVAGDTQRVIPRGPARGLAAAVVEAARAVSRELGAGRWPGGPTSPTSRG
jgi:DNA-binding IclR family transcriptional regulator